jgi:hypothetical protein
VDNLYILGLASLTRLNSKSTGESASSKGCLQRVLFELPSQRAVASMGMNLQMAEMLRFAQHDRKFGLCWFYAETKNCELAKKLGAQK